MNYTDDGYRNPPPNRFGVRPNTQETRKRKTREQAEVMLGLILTSVDGLDMLGMLAAHIEGRADLTSSQLHHFSNKMAHLGDKMERENGEG